MKSFVYVVLLDEFFGCLKVAGVRTQESSAKKLMVKIMKRYKGEWRQINERRAVNHQMAADIWIEKKPLGV